MDEKLKLQQAGMLLQLRNLSVVGGFAVGDSVPADLHSGQVRGGRDRARCKGVSGHSKGF